MRLAHTHLTSALCLAFYATAAGTPLNRDRDPVVIPGDELPSLLGSPVDEILAFSYQEGWNPIPVQIDERKVVDFAVVYNEPPIGITTLAYADPTTYTGADDDAAFDGDDELTFMARDAGVQAPAGTGPPAHTVAGSGLEMAITDPLDGGTGYVYLFRSDGTLPQNAGQDYVTYNFNLLAGDYIPDYDTMSGPNPENSEAFSPYYRTHFSDRWIRDELSVLADDATGVDILDRHKNLFAPGNCSRSEDTFSNGEGAFFANIDGPVRAIRSYMGANSGPLTQRDHIFYEQRHDVTTFLRVHAISGIMDFYDYGPEAVGMSYFNDLNTDGVPVDGEPDVVDPGAIAWEMVSGPQGTVIISHSVTTDIDPFSYTSYYSDDETPSVIQCTGDEFEYAASGLWIDQAIPNTDPYLGPHNILISRRIVYYGSPSESVASAVLRHDQAQTPLVLSVEPFEPMPGDFNGDGIIDLADYFHFADCLSGPETLPSPTEPTTAQNCLAVFDFDGDDDVDLVNYAEFMGKFVNP